MAASARFFAPLVVLLLAAAAHAFIARPGAALSSSLCQSSPVSERRGVASSAIQKSPSQLKMGDKPEIEVISQPGKEFLEKKGCVSSEFDQIVG